MPGTFLHGVLIPIYKTGKDSSKANSYRPVTLSVTLTKILEMYILETCSVHHQPHPAQFGFTSHRGTDMAIAVAHDVSQYYNSRLSSTFTCSLDAEGTFDHIPHSVIFGKLDGMIPDHMWRLLYRWYDSMYVTVRLNGSLGRRLDVRRGVRQGSIISPWIFNCFYRDMVKTVNFNKTRFNKIAIQGTPQMAVDKEALICLSRVYSYNFKCNFPLFYSLSLN